MKCGISTAEHYHKYLTIWMGFCTKLGNKKHSVEWLPMQCKSILPVRKNTIRGLLMAVLCHPNTANHPNWTSASHSIRAVQPSLNPTCHSRVKPTLNLQGQNFILVADSWPGSTTLSQGHPHVLKLTNDWANRPQSSSLLLYEPIWIWPAQHDSNVRPTP